MSITFSIPKCNFTSEFYLFYLFLGKDEVPFNYVIHDEVGPLISVRRSPTSKVTDWGMVAYGGDKHIGKISNFWLHMPGGLGFVEN